MLIELATFRSATAVLAGFQSLGRIFGFGGLVALGWEASDTWKLLSIGARYFS
jgi:hypothetical protein